MYYNVTSFSKGVERAWGIRVLQDVPQLLLLSMYSCIVSLMYMQATGLIGGAKRFEVQDSHGCKPVATLERRYI
jgi:hypothetical protein